MKKRRNKFFDIRVQFFFICMAGFIGVALLAALAAWGLEHLGVNVPMFVWLLIFTLLLGSATAAGFSIAFFAPISRLSRAMKEVAGGNFRVHVETKSVFRDIRDSFDSFNLMVSELNATETLQTDFISNVSHEFKTPISTISLAAQMLGDGSVTKSASMLKHLSGIIVDETKRLRFQVEKVLQMSMFEKKADTFKRKELDANRVIQDIVTTFRLKVETAGGTIDAHVEAAKDMVFVDEMHFTNVVFNLMDNAIKYKHPDRPLQLRVSTESTDSRYIIRVADNGIGIKKEDLKKIFEKFYRVHTGNRHDVKGFGLGLAYVKNVVTALGGNIHAESEYGRGTTFIISLPLLK